MTPRKLAGQIVLIAVPLLAAACVVIASALAQMRENAIADAQRANDTMVSILSQQVFQSVQAIDLLLGDLVTRAVNTSVNDDDDLHQQLGTKKFHEFLVDRLGHLPQATVIAVVDSRGKLIVTTRAWPTPDWDFAKRDHFMLLEHRAAPTLFIGASQIGVNTGQQTVFFSRRLENRNGEFIGAVSIGVRPEFFLRLYDGIAAVPGAFVRLVRPDGKILVSYPDHFDRTKLSDEWREAVRNGGGHFRSSGRLHEVRLVAARPIEGYPLVVNAGVNESNVLDLWWSRAIVAGLAALAVALAVIALVCTLFFLYRKAVEAQARVGQQSKELSNANLRFDSVLTNMKQGVAMFDEDDRIILHNRRYAEMYRLRSEEIPRGTPLASIVDLRIARGIYDTAGPKEYRNRHMTYLGNGVHAHHSALEHLDDGRYVLVSHQPVVGGGWITTHEDVTERQQAAAQIAHMARHDALTGVANRTLFLERVQEAACVEGCCFAVLVIDLDEFKAVNDTFGHPVGDALLAAVSARLRTAIGPRDVVARLGGDEFAILQRLPGPDVGPSSILAASLLTTIRERYHVDGRELKIGLSIGIAATSGALTEPSAIMRQADLALYRAKADGRNCARLFDPAMAEEIQSRRELAIALDAALMKGQLGFIISRSWMPLAAIRSPWRRWHVGIIPCEVASRRMSSFRWPRRRV